MQAITQSNGNYLTSMYQNNVRSDVIVRKHMFGLWRYIIITTLQQNFGKVCLSFSLSVHGAIGKSQGIYGPPALTIGTPHVQSCLHALTKEVPPSPVMFKLVHRIAQTVGNRAVGI